MADNHKFLAWYKGKEHRSFYHERRWYPQQRFAKGIGLDTPSSCARLARALQLRNTDVRVKMAATCFDFTRQDLSRLLITTAANGQKARGSISLVSFACLFILVAQTTAVTDGRR